MIVSQEYGMESPKTRFGSEEALDHIEVERGDIFLTGDKRKFSRMSTTAVADLQDAYVELRSSGIRVA